MSRPEEGPSFGTCYHKLACDPDTGEVFCDSCGVAVPVFEDRARAYAPAGARLSSPSVAGGGLGTDINGSIADLRHGTVDSSTGKRTYMLSGGLRRFFDGNDRSDEALITELCNRLHGRVSDGHLAAIAFVYRKTLKRLEKQKRQRALKLLDQLTGANLG